MKTVKLCIYQIQNRSTLRLLDDWLQKYCAVSSLMYVTVKLMFVTSLAIFWWLCDKA